MAIVVPNLELRIEKSEVNSECLTYVAPGVPYVAKGLQSYVASDLQAYVASGLSAYVASGL
jgi:hypothetical protein